MALEIAAWSACDVLIERPIEGVDIEGASAPGASVICEVPRICCVGCDEFVAIVIGAPPMFCGVAMIWVCGVDIETIGVATCIGVIVALMTCGPWLCCWDCVWVTVTGLTTRETWTVDKRSWAFCVMRYSLDALSSAIFNSLASTRRFNIWCSSSNRLKTIIMSSSRHRLKLCCIQSRSWVLIRFRPFLNTLFPFVKILSLWQCMPHESCRDWHEWNKSPSSSDGNERLELEFEPLKNPL